MKRHKAEQIVAKLRQIEVLTSQGKALPAACKEAAVSEQTYYRWRKEFGGLKLEQAKRLKELEREEIGLSVPRAVRDALKTPLADHREAFLADLGIKGRSRATVKRYRIVLERLTAQRGGLVVADHPKRHDPPVFELNDRFATLRADWVFVELGVTE